MNKLKSTKVTEITGWYGVIAILTAYALVSFKIIESSTLVYQLLNLTGALGIVAVSVSKKDKQPAVLNAIWALVAFIAIGGIVKP